MLWISVFGGYDLGVLDLRFKPACLSSFLPFLILVFEILTSKNESALHFMITEDAIKWIEYILQIHSLIYGHLGCFQ